MDTCISHVFAFPRSGTTSLSQWLTEDNAIHEFEMMNVSRVFSEGILEDEARLRRFCAARQAAIGSRIDITTNLFIFAPYLMQSPDVNACILLRNPLDWCASFIDMFMDVWVDLHFQFPSPSSLSAAESWKRPPWGGVVFSSILSHPLEQTDFQGTVRGLARLMINEWCDHAMMLLNLCEIHNAQYITTTMLSDSHKMNLLFFNSEELSMPAVGQSNAGSNSFLYRQIVSDCVSMNCSLSGDFVSDKQLIVELSNKLNR